MVVSAVAKSSDEVATAGLSSAAAAATRRTAARAREAAAASAASAAGRATKSAAKNAQDAAAAAAKSAEDAAAAAAKSGDTVTKEAAEAAAKRAQELRKLAAQTAIAGGVVGTGIYLEDKYRKADEDTQDCVKTCLPANWDGYEYGDLKKKELQFSTLPNTSDQPVCKESMEDCGEYCDKKCSDIHKYEIPGSKALEGVAGGLGGAAGGIFGGAFSSFFEGFNPFAGMTGIFGEFTWLPFMFSILCVGIILVWGISKLR